MLIMYTTKEFRSFFVGTGLLLLSVMTACSSSPTTISTAQSTKTPEPPTETPTSLPTVTVTPKPPTETPTPEARYKISNPDNPASMTKHNSPC